MNPGFSIRRLSVARAIRLKIRAGNDNPAPAEYRAERFRQLAAMIEATNAKARAAGIEWES